METTLYLNHSEEKLFQALKGVFCEGWKVCPDTFEGYQESSMRMKARLENLSLEGNELKSKALELKGKEFAEMCKSVASWDTSKLSPSDLRDICYAFGPTVLSLIISELLSKAQTQEDLELIGAYSTFRHLYFSDHD